MNKGRVLRGRINSDTGSNSSNGTKSDDDVPFTQKVQGNVDKSGGGVKDNVGKRVG